MSWIDFLQTNVFTVILTSCVTLATYFISTVQGNRKMKVENFESIYNALTDFTEKRAEIIDHCNQVVKELAEAMPDEVQKKSDKEWKKLCDHTYGGINELLTEYSKCLEFMMSFSYYLYKNKPVAPIVTAECWSILYLYENFVTIENGNEYRIRYVQIVTLVQFIRKYGSWRDKKQLHKYLKENKVICCVSKKS